MIICIDIETTGFNENDEILQFAMISDCGDEMSELYRPVYNESWTAAEEINGITPSSVHSKFPFQYEGNLAFIQSLINKADVIVGYNHEYFDIPFLEKYGLNFSDSETYDVMKRFTDYYNQNCNGKKSRYKLVFAAKHFGYEFNPHDAAEDVKATYFIYEQLKKLGY